MNYDEYFDEVAVRRAISAYYGMVSFLDHNIGRVFAALEEAGFADDTRVIYTSDHGDNLGNRGLWGKSVMYEESVAVPMILAGPDVAEGSVVAAPVSLVDCYPTVLEAIGVPLPPEDEGLPGLSLWRIAQGARSERAILSEYHAAGSITGTFMIRHGRWKYIHHVGYAPELFDLNADPGETRDLAGEAACASVLGDCERTLQGLCDPYTVSAMAFRDQARRIEQHGGAEAIKLRGDFGYTPAPGQAAAFT